MTPYYKDDLCTIFCGDSTALMGELNLSDDPVLLVTDPPYGVGERTDRKAAGRGALAECNDFAPVVGDDAPFDPTPWLAFERVVLFGANHFAHLLPPSASWIVWDKRDGIASNDNADCELAWTNLGGPARLYRHVWNGMIKGSERTARRVHPTQKPVALFSWLLRRYARPGDLVFDPYMGSGPIARAAKNLNLRYVGVEIVEHYCRVAVERLRQGAFDLEDIMGIREEMEA